MPMTRQPQCQRDTHREGEENEGEDSQDSTNRHPTGRDYGGEEHWYGPDIRGHDWCLKVVS